MVEMERFCVITNSDKDKDYKTAGYIRDYITASGRSCVIAGDKKTSELGESPDKPMMVSGYTDTGKIPADTQCAIVLGGDGTFIQAANDLLHMEIPLLGVNLGTLGFLAEIEKQNVEQALDGLFQDKLRIENRMMIEGAVASGEGSYRGNSLNDIVISRSGLGRLISVGLYVNQELIDVYRGDGIIVSTPTGSTGYNLSAGGPVLSPELMVMVISPVCPHSLNKRSLVVSSKDEVLLSIGQSKEGQIDEAAAIFDGRMVAELRTGDTITIRKAAVDTKLVKLFHLNFYEILRNKLGIEKDLGNWNRKGSIEE